MSQSDSSNPYQSPQAPSTGDAPPKPPPDVRQEKLELLRAYQYIFENPEWMTVVMWGALMSIIPVVGPLVLFGYVFFVIDALLESRGSRYPVLDVNRFVDYLVRGLWPFLASLVLSVVVIPLVFAFWIAMIVAMLVAREVGGDDAAGIVMLLLMVVLFALWFVVALLLNFVNLPLILRAGLVQDFALTFQFSWIKDFFRKMWLDMLLVMLFLFASSIPFILIGYLTCGIGFFVIQPILVLAFGHLLYQLYAIYLTRGGTPVYPKPKLPPG